MLLNSINECRFNDASYYSWLMANYFAQMSSKHGLEGKEREQYRAKTKKLLHEADIYYAYNQIYNYIVRPPTKIISELPQFLFLTLQEEPFTSVFIDILFNTAMFLFYFIDSNFPAGISKT